MQTTNQHTTTSPPYIVGYPPLLLPFPHLFIMNNITHLHDPTTVFRHSCGTASLWTCSTSTVLPPIFSCPFLPTLPSSAVLRALRPNASLFFSVCYHWHLLFYYLFVFHILTSSKMCTLVCICDGVLKNFWDPSFGGC